MPRLTLNNWTRAGGIILMVAACVLFWILVTGSCK